MPRTLLLCFLAWSCAGSAYSLKLKQVLVLSRHNLRTPLTSSLATMTPKQWPKWDAEVGYLTEKGAMLERNMAEYFSAWLKNEALFSNRCPNEDTVLIYANTKQRTKASAFAFSEAAFPNCDVAVNYRNTTQMDPIFNPIIHSTNDSFKQMVLQEMAKKLKNSDLRDAYLELNEITDIEHSEICEDSGVCNLANMTNVMFFEGQKPTVVGPLYISTMVADAFVMAFYEGFSLEDIGWGKIKNGDQWKLLTKVLIENQSIRFNVTLAAKDIAKPLLKFMKEVIESQIEFALLVGHESNQMSVLSSMGFKPYDLPEQLELTPIGGKLVFQKWTDGPNDFLKVEFVYQSWQQLRHAVKLSLSNPPKKITLYLDKCIANDDGFCRWSDFEKLLDENCV